ncbi:MAG: biotin--[acetyl-CoA-carboxylase] ligase [Arcobacteraceae bacterium]
MEICFLDSVESTHLYLKEYIKKNGYVKPLCIVTNNQTQGIGSRDNTWEGKKGNLFFSFVIDKKHLTDDLPIQSTSIYFSFILKELLTVRGSKIWLKWPNDFYIDDKKIGGTITNKANELYYCGIGLNLQFIQESYGYLDIEIEIQDLLQNYFSIILQKKTWKQVFSKYLIEFENSKEYTATIHKKKASLKSAFLNDDGSITIDDKKVFSLR